MFQAGPEYQSKTTISQWSYVDNYMTWFYSVSHPIMTPNALERPSMPAHEEILKNEQARDDHAQSKKYADYA